MIGVHGSWLTIATVVRNDAAGLAATVRSVRRQDLRGVEHLIIDGASTDATREVLTGLRDTPGVRVISEADKGIYDAMNKGWRHADGFWIQYLNAGDVYSDDDQVTWVRERLAAQPARWLRTRVRFVDARGAQTRPLGDAHIDRSFWWGWQTTLHQGAFMTRDLLADLGGFDDSLRIQADYDLMRRAVEGGCVPLVDDHVTVDVDASGVSTLLWRVGFGEMHRSRSKGRAAPVRLASAADYGVHVSVVAGRRTARRALEKLLGAQRLSELRN